MELFFNFIKSTDVLGVDPAKELANKKNVKQLLENLIINYQKN